MCLLENIYFGTHSFDDIQSIYPALKTLYFATDLRLVDFYSGEFDCACDFFN